MIIWVIGAGGLLGSEVIACARGRGDTVFACTPVPWADPGQTVETIRTDAFALRRRLSEPSHLNSRWGIVWAAGHATTSSSEEQTGRELETFRSSLRAINDVLSTTPGGTLVLASSAGGVYAGGSNPPFTSQSDEAPLGVYGRLKVAQERAAREILNPSIAVLITRIANLYGPGQDLSKLQGLISRLALTSVTKQPLTMFVPLDTLRDFITANDAAQRLIHWLDTDNQRLSVRVIASGQAVSLGYVINVLKDITRTATPIAYGIHASAVYQSADLRLTPDLDDTIKSLPLTPLPVGIKEVYDDILKRHQDGLCPVV